MTNQTTTTLSLKWTIGGNGLSPITGIEIIYHNPEEDFIEIEDVPEVVETYTLVNLRPSTLYIIRVYIVNAVGQSEPSTTTGETGKTGGKFVNYLLLNYSYTLSASIS